jgi:hypothetical protein
MTLPNTQHANQESRHQWLHQKENRTVWTSASNLIKQDSQCSIKPSVCKSLRKI